MPEPGPERALEDLLSELYEPDTVRRFVHRTFGNRASRRLPTPPVAESILFHEVSKLLVSLNLMDQQTFIDLAAEHPGQQGRIQEVATLFDVGRLPTTAIQRVQQELPSVPEHVIRDIYDDLKRQQGLVQQFMGGPWARLNEARMGGVNQREHDDLAAECERWTKSHIDQINIEEIYGALMGLRFTHPINPLGDDGSFFLTLATVLVTEGAVLKPIVILKKFAAMGPKDLWHMAEEKAKGS